MIREFPVHDASFDGIITAGENSSLYFTLTDGSGCTIELIGVKELQLDDFQKGNIAISCEAISGQQITQGNDWTRLFPGPHPSAPQEYRARHTEFVATRAAAVETGSLTFVRMHPAIGAHLSALCETATFKSHGIGTAPSV